MQKTTLENALSIVSETVYNLSQENLQLKNIIDELRKEITQLKRESINIHSNEEQYSLQVLLKSALESMPKDKE